MGLLDRLKKHDAKGPPTVIGNGKYCIYHHGAVVLKHKCGASLCRECLWESRECPFCHELIEESVEKGKKKEAEREAKGELEELKLKKETVEGEEAEIIRPKKRHVRKEEERGEEGEKTEEVEEVREVEGEVLSVEIRGIREGAEVEEEEETVEREAGEDAPEGEQRVRRPRAKPVYTEGSQPLYKKRKHAKILKEEEKEEEKKKKVSVRTVPPVEGTRKSFESL